MNNKSSVRHLALSSVFLALCLVLPFLTGQIKEIGNMLCPMHIPVLLCGFFCGPLWGAAVGIAAPLLRFCLFGMPQIFPSGLAMCAELALYGFTCGALNKALPPKKAGIYISLICAMLSGRIAWGGAMLLFALSGKAEFSLSLFFSGAFINAVPGIIVQILLVPPLVILLDKYTAKYMT